VNTIVESRHIGRRIAEARRQLPLSQKHFAERVGVSLWTLDQIESGAVDAGQHLPEIATVTGRPERWFGRDGTTAAIGQRGSVSRTRIAANLRWHPDAGRDLVLGSIALLVLVRFFTEVLHVLPRAANFADIPIFVALSTAALTRPRPQRSAGPFALPVVLFLCLSTISVSFNLSRIEPGPVLVFLYGFLAPIGVYAAAYRLWPAGHALSLSRLLVALGVLQLVVVAAVDVPRFISSGNPDVVSGTFGTNAYQMVFFLLLVTALVAGIFTFEKHRLTARFAVPIFGGILTAILLAQYRALLVTTALTVLLIGLLLGTRGRGIVAATVVAVSFAVSLSYVAHHLPVLKFAPTLETLRQNPSFYASKRLEAADSVLNLYAHQPSFILTGSGPGTFSSRAWHTFAQADSKSASNVQGRYVNSLTGGRIYHTDVSDKYVVPTESRAAIGGSRALTSPFSSYLSLLAEVGLPGFLLMVAVYLVATGTAINLTFRTRRRPVPGDPLPALALACAIGFLVLLQMGLLENWLEVTRITFPAWMLLGVTSKEFASRAVAET
jgi:transcriptional regulator with XRE-family HTH domain